jgi:hypothetical protein
MEALSFSFLSSAENLRGLGAPAVRPTGPFQPMWSVPLPYPSCSLSWSHPPCPVTPPRIAPHRNPAPSAPRTAPCTARSTDGIQVKRGNQAEDLNQENRNLNSLWKSSIPLILRTMETCRTLLVSTSGQTPIK